MATIVTGDLYESLDGKLHELKRQIRQKGGYPFDPTRLDRGLQAFIEGRFDAVGELPTGLPVTYDQSIGLLEIIKRAVGKKNHGNINTGITQERFPLKGTDVRTVNVRVEPFLNGETGEQAAKRLTAAGHVLASTGDLAGFLFDHPQEVEKWNRVVALSKDLRWSCPVGFVFVPFALVRGALRLFDLVLFRREFHSGDGVLVLCE